MHLSQAISFERNVMKESFQNVCIPDHSHSFEMNHLSGIMCVCVSRATTAHPNHNRVPWSFVGQSNISRIRTSTDDGTNLEFIAHVFGDRRPLLRHLALHFGGRCQWLGRLRLWHEQWRRRRRYINYDHNNGQLRSSWRTV